jgi:nicotinamide riboside kinase
LLSGDQHVLVNDWVAMVAAQYVYKLLHRERIDSFMTYIDTDTLTTKSLPISADEIRSYLPLA